LPEEIPNIDMEKRISRKDDESLYQPKIHSKRIRSLFSLREETGKPMTDLVDQAIHELVESYRTDNLEEPAVERKERSFGRSYREKEFAFGHYAEGKFCYILVKNGQQFGTKERLQTSPA
jgi:hypothetical protein